MSKPYIPIETQKRMHAFFMKTSAPRIYAEMQRKEKQGKSDLKEYEK